MVEKENQNILTQRMLKFDVPEIEIKKELTNIVINNKKIISEKQNKFYSRLTVLKGHTIAQGKMQKIIYQDNQVSEFFFKIFFPD